MSGAMLGILGAFQNCGPGFSIEQMGQLTNQPLNDPNQNGNAFTPNNPNNSNNVGTSPSQSITQNPTLYPNSNDSTGRAPYLINNIPAYQWSPSENTKYSAFDVVFSEALLGRTSTTVGILYTGIGSMIYGGGYLQQNFDSNGVGVDVSEIMVFDKDSRQLLGHRKIRKTTSSNVADPIIKGAFNEADNTQNLNAVTFGYQILSSNQYGAGKRAIVVINDRSKQRYYYKEVSLQASGDSTDSNLLLAKKAEEARGITQNNNISSGPGWIDLPRIAGRNDGGGALYAGSVSFSGHFFNPNLSGNSLTVPQVHGAQSESHYMHSAHVFDQAGNFLGANRISTTNPFTSRSSTQVNNLNLTGVTFLRVVQVDTFNGVVTDIIQLG